MAFELANFQDPELDADYVGHLVDQQAVDASISYGRLWDYFRNPFVPATSVMSGALNSNSRPYFQAQEVGLPPRITGLQRIAGVDAPSDLQRKEVVIENDIAWRIHTMVDFLFGRPVTIHSLAADEDLARLIERVISTMLDANGGVSLFQEVALFGSIYGLPGLFAGFRRTWRDSAGFRNSPMKSRCSVPSLPIPAKSRRFSPIPAAM